MQHPLSSFLLYNTRADEWHDHLVAKEGRWRSERMANAFPVLQEMVTIPLVCKIFYCHNAMKFCYHITQVKIHVL